MRSRDGTEAAVLENRRSEEDESNNSVGKAGFVHAAVRGERWWTRDLDLVLKATQQKHGAQTR